MEEIDGNIFRVMIIKAADQIIAYEKVLNELNYFPVRDKDTGTNLRIVFENIKKKIIYIETKSVGEILKLIKDISIRVSKGNSGNILSMFFYGLYQELKSKEKITLRDLSNAIKKAREYAYKSVKDPKEGTMLTVIRVMEEEIDRAKNLVDWLRNSIKRSIRELEEKRREINLKNTIDSGGLGMILMLKGWIKALGNDIKINIKKYLKKEEIIDMNNELFCVNILAKPRESLEKIKDVLQEDSLLISEVDGYIKIHFHTPSVEESVSKLLPYLEIEDIKVERAHG